MNLRSNRRTIRQLLGAGVSVVFLFLFACQSPIGEVGFSESEKPRFAIPLLSTSFTLEDALGGFNFVGTLTDGSEGLRLVREDTIFVREVLDAVSIPNLPAPLNDTLNTLSLTSIGFNLPVDTIGFSSGTLFYAYSNSEDERVDVSLELVNFATSTGEVFTVDFSVPANETLNDNVSLANTVASFNANKDVVINYTARTSSGEAVKAGSFVLFIQDLEESFAIGTLAGYVYDLGSTTINTDFFSAFIPNSASLRDASVNFEVTNTSLLPLDLEKVATYAALRDGSRLDFTTPFDRGVPIDFPSSRGDTARQIISLDAQNSSFFDAVQQFPDSLVFELQALVNPGLNPALFRVENGDGLIGTFKFDVPLAINFDGFQVEQPINFGQLERTERLDNVELSITATNLSGLNARAQVYLFDSLANAGSIDSLFSEPLELLQAASLDADGAAVSSSVFRQTVTLSEEDLALIRNIPTGTVRVILDTPGDQDTFAQLNYTDSLGLNVGLSFNLLPE